MMMSDDSQLPTAKSQVHEVITDSLGARPANIF